MSSANVTDNGHRGENGHSLLFDDTGWTFPSSTTNGNGAATEVLATPTHASSTASVSLVIPAKNEARNLAWVLEQVPDWLHEVILVDGLSTDATLEMAVACRPDIRIVHEQRPGKGVALRAGFQAADGDIVAMLDADGSMSPAELPRFVHLLEDGYDFVKGSRFVAGGGSLDITRFRQAGNRGLMALVSTIYRERLTDLCYGFMAFRRRYLPYLALQSDGFEIETEMVLRAVKAGLRIAEVPSLELPRRSGESNLNAMRDGMRVLRTVLAERKAGRSTPAPPVAAIPAVAGGDGAAPQLAVHVIGE